MERLTKYWGNGEYGLINAFVTKNAEMCNALGRYEDEAEQRDDGCDMCKDITPDVPGVCRMDTLYMVYYDYAGESHDLSAEPPNYCPFCGRKLVE